MSSERVEMKTEQKPVKTPDRYIYTPDAVFRGDILDTRDEADMSERRKKRLEEGRKKKERSEAAKKRIKHGFIFAVSIIAVVLLFMVTVGKNIVKLVELQEERSAKEKQLQALREELQKNEDILKQVNSDEYIEQKARSEFNMIKDGEILYRIGTDPRNGAAAAIHAEPADDVSPGEGE